MTTTATKGAKAAKTKPEDVPATGAGALKITCSRADLVEALATAATVAPAKSTKRILESVLLRASVGGKFEVFATDLDASARLIVHAADIEGSGPALEVAVNARRALSLAKAITDDKVTIESRDLGVLRIASAPGSTGNTKFDIVTEADPMEFPDVAFLAAPAPGSAVVLEGPAFELALGRVHVAVGDEDDAARYALNGVAFDWTREGALSLVATNGNNLACAKIPAPGSAPGALSVISARSVAALRKFVAGAAKVLARFDATRATFALGDGSSGEVLTAQLVVGKHFPPYEGAIPGANRAEHVVTLNRAALVEAIEAAALVTTKDSRSVRWAFTFKKLTLSARGPDAGESAIELTCSWTGDPLEIALDPRYVLAALGSVGGPGGLDVVALEFRTPAAPVVLRVEDQGFVYVVMPITIG